MLHLLTIYYLINLSFSNGEKRSELVEVGKVGSTNTGTTIQFWQDQQYFDSINISIPKLKHVLKAKAVLCPGLTVKLKVEKPAETKQWFYCMFNDV